MKIRFGDIHSVSLFGHPLVVLSSLPAINEFQAASPDNFSHRSSIAGIANPPSVTPYRHDLLFSIVRTSVLSYCFILQCLWHVFLCVCLGGHWRCFLNGFCLCPCHISSSLRTNDTHYSGQCGSPALEILFLAFSQKGPLSTNCLAGRPKEIFDIF